MFKSKSKPNFIGIGAQKSATTWLYHVLKAHPQVWMTPKKEINFFDRNAYFSGSLDTQKIFYNSSFLKTRKMPISKSNLIAVIKTIYKQDWRSILWWSKWYLNNNKYNDDWYINLFSLASPQEICGEITPSYSCLSSEEIQGIKNINPQMKIIFIIRNPIERSWSSIRFHAQRNNLNVEEKTEEEIIAELQHPGLIMRSNYERTIDVYLKQFAPEQILVCYYDAIVYDLQGFLSDLTKFLEIKDFEQPMINYQHKFNVSPPQQIPALVKEYLIETYNPMINRLAQKYGSYAQLWNQSVQNGAINYNYNPNHLCLKATFHP